MGPPSTEREAMQPAPAVAPRGVRGLLSGLLDLLYPPRCVVCEQRGAWLCASCIAKAPVLGPRICRHCGKPTSGEELCADCWRGQSLLAGMRSVAPHLPPYQEAIHALKYEGLRVLAEPLGEVMAGYWRREPLPVSIVVPVPLHKARLRQRGYNQSLLLARAFARRIGLQVREDCLVRERNTRSQVGLSADERWANVSGAFRCTGRELHGESVLLIDDVLTTGATLEACAAALLQEDAKSVWAFTLTHAVHAPDAA